MAEMPTFVYMVKLVRREMFERMPLEEEVIIDEHFEYLKRGSAEGRVILAGRCEDREFGIVVFRAASEEEAKDFMKNDPAVKKGVTTAELHPFRVALIEKS